MHRSRTRDAFCSSRWSRRTIICHATFLYISFDQENLASRTERRNVPITCRSASTWTHSRLICIMYQSGISACPMPNSLFETAPLLLQVRRVSPKRKYSALSRRLLPPERATSIPESRRWRGYGTATHPLNGETDGLGRRIVARIWCTCIYVYDVYMCVCVYYCTHTTSVRRIRSCIPASVGDDERKNRGDPGDRDRRERER